MSKQAVREVSWGAGRVDAGPPIGVNGWAKWAAICGVLALAPLGFVFGVVGLVKTFRTGQRGKGLALLGLVASLAWSVCLYSIAEQPGQIERNADGRVSHAQEASIWDVQTGDCFRWIATGPGGDVQEVTLVPCAEQHDARVYAMPDLGLMADDRASDAAKAACQGALAKAGLPATTNWSDLYPTNTDLTSVNRQAVCFSQP